MFLLITISLCFLMMLQNICAAETAASGVPFFFAAEHLKASDFAEGETNLSENRAGKEWAVR